MPSVPEFLHLAPEVWIGAGVGIFFGVLVLWLLIRAGRRRFVTLSNSPSTELIAYQLGRIADALERVSRDGVSVTPEVMDAPLDTPPPSGRRAAGRVSMSMFGR